MALINTTSNRVQSNQEHQQRSLKSPTSGHVHFQIPCRSTAPFFYSRARATPPQPPPPAHTHTDTDTHKHKHKHTREHTRTPTPTHLGTTWEMWCGLVFGQHTEMNRNTPERYRDQRAISHIISALLESDISHHIGIPRMCVNIYMHVCTHVCTYTSVCIHYVYICIYE
jgi:hypothetical protein